MVLPRDYATQACSMARSLEIVGERWTLLIVRDAFYGVRRFNDFAAHLRIPRAVLAQRLTLLVDEQILDRVAGVSGRDEYQLTDKGLGLFPVVHSLIAWGDEHYAPKGPRRVFLHDSDNGPLDIAGVCSHCHAQVSVADTLVVPGPGLEPLTDTPDPVTAALTTPHQLLDPLPNPTS